MLSITVLNYALAVCTPNLAIFLFECNIPNPAANNHYAADTFEC